MQLGRIGLVWGMCKKKEPKGEGDQQQWLLRRGPELALSRFRVVGRGGTWLSTASRATARSVLVEELTQSICRIGRVRVGVDVGVRTLRGRCNMGGGLPSDASHMRTTASASGTLRRLDTRLQRRRRVVSGRVRCGPDVVVSRRDSRCRACRMNVTSEMRGKRGIRQILMLQAADAGQVRSRRH